MRVDPYHLIAGRIDPVEREQRALKLDIARPLIARALGGPTAVADGAVEAFLAHLDGEETLTYSVAFTVTGVAGVPGVAGVTGGAGPAGSR
ncbi:hypothetical protein ACFXGT_08680 [Streptomyces sp. NPDC059352]|uniref:hypothetical protein n=1 Tax=Streptomyces sp. NPDC059352 TaxID=3346810 RepID=UPI0036982F89